MVKEGTRFKHLRPYGKMKKVNIYKRFFCDFGGKLKKMNNLFGGKPKVTLGGWGDGGMQERHGGILPTHTPWWLIMSIIIIMSCVFLI